MAFTGQPYKGNPWTGLTDYTERGEWQCIPNPYRLRRHFRPPDLCRGWVTCATSASTLLKLSISSRPPPNHTKKSVSPDQQIQSDRKSLFPNLANSSQNAELPPGWSQAVNKVSNAERKFLVEQVHLEKAIYTVLFAEDWLQRSWQVLCNCDDNSD